MVIKVMHELQVQEHGEDKRDTADRGHVTEGRRILAQRPSPSSPVLSSSPPSASVPLADLDWFAESRDVPSPAQTLWTAPSPTQTLGYSSPELPPLPSLPSLAGLPQTPASSRHQPSDSIYYTASWGSPYDGPLAHLGRDGSIGAHRRISTLSSDDLEEDSSGFEFGLDHLLPSRLPLDHSETYSPNLRFSLEHLLPSRLPAEQQLNTPTTPTRSRPGTQGQIRRALPTTIPEDANREWIQQFLADRGHFSQPNSSSPLSVAGEPSDKTPSSASPNLLKRTKFVPGHKTRKANLTLKQEDFLDIISQSNRQASGKMLASKYADPVIVKQRTASQTSISSPRSSKKRNSNSISLDPVYMAALVSTEKPLPRPLAENAEQGQRLPVAASSITLDAPLPMPEKALAPPRRRKAFPGKSRKVWVHLPTDGPRGGVGQSLMPLSQSEVSARLRRFEDAGYDTRGFDHWGGITQPIGSEIGAQNRGHYPNALSIAEDRQQNPPRTRIPDKSEWDNYIKELNERKLRALGVLFGDEPAPATEPPVMSRQASSQYPALPFSPPLPSSSTNSHRYSQSGVGLTGSFGRGPSPGHVSTRSIASPMSAFGNSRPSFHMHRHSTFSPSSFQQLPTPPGVHAVNNWSPQQMFNQFGVARGGSPALSQPLRQDIGAIRSPISPFGMGQQPPQYPFPGPDDLMSQFHQQQQQQHQLQAQLAHQQQQQQLVNLRPTSTLAEVPEDEAEDEDVVSDIKPGLHAEIAEPKPRGHRHNISAQLERDVHEAEYHLEKAIDRQLEPGGDFSTSVRFDKTNGSSKAKPKPAVHTAVANRAWDESDESSPQILHQPQPHNRAHSLAKQQEIAEPADSSDREVSLAPTEISPKERDDGVKTNASDFTNPSEEEQNKRSRNALAEHSRNTSAKSPALPVNKAASTHSKEASTSSISKLNVAAKEFKFNPSATFNPVNFATSGFSFQPTSNMNPFGQAANHVPAQPIPGLGSSLNVAAPVFQPPSTLGGAAVPSSDFSFASKGPSFKPDAPSFQPSADAKTSGIFGGIDISSYDVTSARRTKAVPIVHPDDTTEQDDDWEEDAQGRITQAEGRQKRARRFGDDGDDEPLFATPTQPLAESTNFGASKQENLESKSTPRDKENIAPMTNVIVDSSLPAGKDTKPVVTHRDQIFDEEETNRTYEKKYSPSTHSTSPSSASSSVRTELPSQKLVYSKHTSRPSLSATAKPFVFRPAQNDDYDFGVHVTQPSTSDSMANFPTHQQQHLASPPRQASRSPATTFRPSDDGSYKTAPHVPYPDDESVDYDSFIQPSFNEIDAVMKHLNDEGSDFGVERADDNEWMQSSPRRRAPLETFGQTDLRPMTNIRSDAPSPSPRRLYAAMPDGPSGSTSATHDPFSDRHAGIAYESPIHRLNVGADAAVSDWDDIVSSDQDEKVQSRSQFFDSHVDNLIGNILQKRLGPLEQHLIVLQESLNALPKRRGRSSRLSRSTERLDSDADDEDDEPTADSFPRTRSPRDRRLEKIKTIVLDAVNGQQRTTPALDMTEFYKAIGDMRSSMAESCATALHNDDIIRMIEEAFSRQNTTAALAREDTIKADTNIRIRELEQQLHDARLRVEIESGARKEAEIRESETHRVAQLAAEESRLLRETSSDELQRFHALDEECQELRLKIVALESSEEDLGHRLSGECIENKALRSRIGSLENTEDALRSKLSLVTKQAEALEATLEEYRLSNKKWREELRQATADRENSRKSVDVLKLQSEEAVRIREIMRGKIEKLQQDMVMAANQIAREKSDWQKQDEEHCKKYEVLSARIEAEAMSKERLERELERLESQEREGMKIKVLFEETQKANSRLEEMVSAARHEALEHQKTAEKWEREFHEAREVGRVEIQRTRHLLEADIETANNQVNVVRADLEAELTRVRADLDSVKMNADTAKAKHELELEEAFDSKKLISVEASEGRRNALIEQQGQYERRIVGLEKEHERALQIALEDKSRIESTLQERLDLANDKLSHFQDKIHHLEDKFNVAKSAAHAAAQAAQAAQATAALPMLSPSATATSSDAGPGKVSSQALRESIMVLQEQLQERESRIENLEHKLADVDTDAPARLKERDTEIGWLRELLGVRTDDLTDLINALSKPSFNPDAVRDAAIRIRTNLQMEQQEKERLVSASNGNGNNRPVLPTLSTLSNFASPKAVQLAAAIGNWRKGKEARETSNLGLPSSTSSSRTQTPSKPPAPALSSSQGFFSGLMTPPTSNLRRTPELQPKTAGFPALSLTPRQRGKQSVLDMEAPSTPTLLKSAGYDQDAEDGRYSVDGFYDDEDSTTDGVPDGRNMFEVFGGSL